MNRILPFLTLLVCLFACSAGYTQDSLNLFWNRCIGGTGDDMVRFYCPANSLGQNYVDHSFIPNVLIRPDISVTADGGLILVQTTHSKDGDVAGLRKYSDTATNGSDIYVSKLSADGITEWKKCFGGSGDDYGSAVYVDTDGYVICGSTASADGDFNNPTNYPLPFIIKLDLKGNVVWEATYTQGYPGGIADCHVEAVRKMPNGGYVLLLNRFRQNSYVFISTELMQVTNTGAFKNLTVYSGNNSVVAAGMVMQADGSLLIAGTTGATTGELTTSISPWVSGYLAKLVDNGNGYTISWKKFPWTLNNASHTRIYDVVQSRDGSIFLGGSNIDYNGGEGRGMLFRFDSSGNPKWTKNLYATSYHRMIFALDTAGSNGVLFSAITDGNCGFGYNQVVIGRMDTSGTQSWQKCYSGNKDEYGLEVKYVSETAYYVAALTNSTSSLPTHTYNVYDPGASFCATDFWLLKASPGNIISGSVYLDQNKNGNFEFTEPLLPNVWIKTGKDTINTKGVYTLSGGFNFAVDTGKYITRVVLPPGLPFDVSPATDTYTFSGTANKRNVNFGVKATANIYDAELDFSPVTLARVNRPVYYKISYRNIGSNPLGSHTVKMVKDSRLTVVSSNPAATIAGDTLSWTFASLQLLSEREIDITLHTQMPPVTDVGDTLKLSAKIEYAQTDATPANNRKQIEQLIVGPYDPNDKHEIHNGSIDTLAYAAGEYLNYLINFQNIGSDTAFYVEVRDTLGPKLDARFLEVLHSSHFCNVSILNNKFITFKFPNANLPPKSTNEEGSKGYVVFKIKPVANLVVKDSVKNTASIYFDYNAPVVTNTVVTRITACTVAKPVITAVGNTNLCQGNTVILRSSAASGNQWFRDGVAIGGATSQTLSVSQGGNYTVIATQNGCSSTPSVAMQVTVVPTPSTPGISQNGNILTSSAATGNQWYLNGAAIAGAVQQTFIPVTSGQYSVRLSAGGCTSAFSNPVNYIVTSLGSPAPAGQLVIAPNPVHDKLFIRDNSGNTRLVVSIYDAAGKQKLVQRLIKSGEVNMAGLAAGIYTVRVVNERTGETVVRVVVKE